MNRLSEPRPPPVFFPYVQIAPHGAAVAAPQGFICFSSLALSVSMFPERLAVQWCEAA